MIELLGIGVPREGGGWLLHRVCARIDAPALTAVVASEPAQRHALCDVIVGRRLADEGRAWVDGTPVTRTTRARIMQRATRVDLDAPLVEPRTALYNVLRAAPALYRLLPMSAARRRTAAQRALAAVRLDALAAVPAASLGVGARIRLRLACALVNQPRYLVADLASRDSVAVADEVRVHLRRLVDVVRVGVVVGAVATDPVVQLADRVIALAGGLLVYDGAPTGFETARTRHAGLG